MPKRIIKKAVSFFDAVKPKKIILRHYFGGVAFIIFLLQFVTGLYMIFYYEPSLTQTYKTVQYFNNETTFGAFTRNLHRYGAFFMVVALFVHFWRAYFRKDFQGKRWVNWLSGMALIIVVAAFVISGSILPWEWKGYWLMEMFNNWLKVVPLVGDDLYTFFMTSYTPTRNFVIHDIILPLIAVAALEIHLFRRLRKRGVNDYLKRAFVASLPVLGLIVALSLIYPVPTEDPEIIPLPMEGQYIPAPEWFFVTFLLPYWYYPPRLWSFFLFWTPFVIFVVLAALPFIVRKKKKEELEKADRRKLLAARIAYAGAGALLCVALVGGTLWGSVESPWMGCNSCHNTAMGIRMGIPPVTYKDTERNPLLLDNRWMMRHWYEPQVVW